MKPIATRYTLDGNPVPPGTRGWDPRLRMHVEKVFASEPGGDDWYITGIGLYRNHLTSAWDDEYTFRHTEDKSPYCTELEQAITAATALIESATTNA